MKWRKITSESYNFHAAPWSGAVGIEEDDKDAAVPALVCWFTRGWKDVNAMVDAVVQQHNAAGQPGIAPGEPAPQLDLDPVEVIENRVGEEAEHIAHEVEAMNGKRAELKSWRERQGL